MTTASVWRTPALRQTAGLRHGAHTALACPQNQQSCERGGGPGAAARRPALESESVSGETPQHRASRPFLPAPPGKMLPARPPQTSPTRSPPGKVEGRGAGGAAAGGGEELGVCVHTCMCRGELACSSLQGLPLLPAGLSPAWTGGCSPEATPAWIWRFTCAPAAGVQGQHKPSAVPRP